jgi:hypothetical protein
MQVVDVFCKKPFQMTFIHRDNMIEQISPAAFYPSLRHTILPGAFEGGSDGVHPQGSHCHADLHPTFGVMVENQIFGYRLEWKRLSQLLHNPLACRVPGDVKVQDPSAIMTDDKEAVERAKGDEHGG